MSQWGHRLRELATLDSGRRIFGAQSKVPGRGHRYEARRIGEQELAAFESWCGGALPPAYRQYLLDVGLGPGPYYGLMPLEKIREELAIIYEDCAEEFGTDGLPGCEFALEDELKALRSRDPAASTDFPGPRSPGGFIPICFQGCDFIVVMVTSGTFAGSVFTATNFAATGSRWRAAGRPPGVVTFGEPHSRLPGFPPWPDFAQWIDGWLEQCFADLGDGLDTT
jgi:hypothetical protein